MRVVSTPLEGLFEVEFPVTFDGRGSFQRVFDADAFRRQGLFGPAVHVNLSHNPAVRTLRGLHYQAAPRQESKIVTCVSGAIFDVVLDLRPDSETFGQWYGTRLAAADGRSLVVPELCAHGFLTLEAHSIVHYTMSQPYVQDLGRGVRWNDPAFAIDWPLFPSLISERDSTFPDHGL
jgi:dTDP-4-dehydrorhamnose 3,5-epimerase